MNWFSGSVADAVHQTLASQSYLLIFLSDDSDTSVVVQSMLKESNFQRLSSDRKIVCLKLMENSLECNQFGEIYPISFYPAIYFIDSKGQVLGCFGDEVLEKRILEDSLVNLFEQNPELKELYDSVDPASDLSLEEKQAVARQAIAKAQAAKKQQAEEKAKEEELKRRELGKAVLSQQKLREEEEVRRVADERKREKREAEAERKRILAQIKQDREELKRSNEFQVETNLAEPVEPVCSLPKKVSNESRLLFRLPDGTPFIQHFDADIPFAEAAESVFAQISERREVISFETSDIPRKVVDGDERSKTLRELNLAPSGTIFVKVRMSLLKSDPDPIPLLNIPGALLGFVTNSVYSVWGYVYHWFYASNNAPSQAAAETEPSSSSSGDRENLRRRRLGRLSNLGEDSDDARWNGNSTQFQPRQ